MVGDDAHDLAVLRHKRAATRYRILVEIAEHQPAISQREIADAIGVTSQAVSEYVRDLVEEGYVRKGGRGRYRITKEGVDWVISRTDELRSFTEHVALEVFEQVDVEAAIADATIAVDQPVALSMDDGAMHATPIEAASDDRPGARARAVTAAAAGESVGVTDFEGLLDYERGSVTILQIPPVGSDASVDASTLAGELPADGLVAVAGTEALALVRAAGREPDLRYGTVDAVQEAAARGIDVVLVAVEGDVSAHADRLAEQGLEYGLVDLGT